MPASDIVIKGAREHNLRDVSLVLPRNQLICLTGVSGSGKSSLAFDTLYAEGQRRYVESLSSYARHFLGQMPKPDVDFIGGLSPSISISQKSSGNNPRSTVGTVTEIYDYLRVLFARVGQGHCPKCQRIITAQSREEILARIQQLPAGTKFAILAPLIRQQKGEYKDLFEDLLKQGFVRARVDGDLVQLSDKLSLDRQMRHDIEVVIDRLAMKGDIRPRLAEAVELALRQGEGNLIVATEEEVSGSKFQVPSSEDDPTLNLEPETLSSPGKRRKRNAAREGDMLFSSAYACTHCGLSFEPPSPQLFSFNSPQGMCQVCDGLGVQYSFDPDLLAPFPKLSFKEGCFELIGPWHDLGRWRRHIYQGVAETVERKRELKAGTMLDTPWHKLDPELQKLWLHGTADEHITFTWRAGNKPMLYGGRFEGLVPDLAGRYKNSKSKMQLRQLEKYMRMVECPDCHGERLVPQARAMRITGVSSQGSEVGGQGSGVRGQGSGVRGQEPPSPQPLAPSPSFVSRTLPQVCGMAITEAVKFFEALELDRTQQLIAEEVLKEIRTRLGFLVDVGLEYLTLDRTAPTLSGGESQRIRLAGQIGSGLVGVLYILDEPSIGLHPRDNDRLLRTLRRLRDMGNTVVVVEHDEETMWAADQIIDFGPGPGVRGGELVVQGPPGEVIKHPRSLTGQYLSGARQIEIPAQRRPTGEKWLKILGATQNNLKDIDVEIPLGNFVCVTGVSGSGKSSLVSDILVETLHRDLNKGEGTPGAHRAIEGLEHLDKLIAIDQTPIGRTPRSNPGTYIKVFDEIRDLFCQMPEAKRRGYKPGRFSFNVAGGRCEACEGNGSNRLEMDFLADVWVTCPVCEGKRFSRETLQVRFKEKSIADVLEMDIQQLLVLFENVPHVRHKLQTLHDVGLDYLKLGQPSPTLSGGEAQRIKLARELVKKSTGKTLYLLDEPTTGLHFADIQLLLKVLHDFVAAGNTVLVVEHNLDVIKTADWVIDLGPEGGDGGGQVVTVGTPEEVAAYAEGSEVRGQESSKGKPYGRSSPSPQPPAPSPSLVSHTGHSLISVLDGTFAAAMREAARQLDKPGKNGKSRKNAPVELATHIVVRGARQHNLKGVDARIERDKMTVFCGQSGSGKSSLAMDTIYAEGQRRYVESLSSYARQFVAQMQKPAVDHIDGLSPAIAIEQKNLGHTPRSTVGTVTEIYDYLRILMARLGQLHCPACEIAVGTQSADQVVDSVLALPAGTRLFLMAPVEIEVGQQYALLWEQLRSTGYSRVRIDGMTYSLDAVPEIDRRRKHKVEVVLDRLAVKADARSRIAGSVENALALGKGVMHVALANEDVVESKWEVVVHSQHLACRGCGRSFEPLTPHSFSFNSPLGWCKTCEGLGVQIGANPAALLRDSKLTLAAGALDLWPNLQQPIARAMLEALGRGAGIPLDVPYERLTAKQRRMLLHGTGEQWFEVNETNAPLSPRAHAGNRRLGAAAKRETTFRFQFKGLYPALEETSKMSPSLRIKLEHLVGEVACSTCDGSRLRDDASAVRFRGKSIGELGRLPLGELGGEIEGWKLTSREQKIAGELAREINGRLQFLLDVGLEYLSLSRPAATLSNGEAQRIRLASQLGSGLCGVLYVLDEPTIGLHPRDNTRLLKALHKLRDLGNTLIVVEHDKEVIEHCDRVLDFGPGAGRLGGQIVADAVPEKLGKASGSVTGPYLSGKKAIPVPKTRRTGIHEERVGKSQEPNKASGRRKPPGSVAPSITPLQPPAPSPCIEVLGARHNNLKNIDVRIPLGTLTAITGPSGSGKSTLVDDILYAAIARKLHRASLVPGKHDAIQGLEHINKVIRVDQQPLGNSPTSNPATYTGAFELIRTLFAQLPEAKLRGYSARRFSFNVAGGRCEACEGNGQRRIEMHFLPDVWVECETCRGKRYNPETLGVTFHGSSISGVLDMTCGDAVKLFENIPKIRRILETLCEVGLDYLTLGQSAPTLSGGEAQRVKLAAELSRPDTGRTLYLLDEPTTGLHFDDLAKLLEVLQRLVDLGNTVVVIEHNLDIIKSCDWMIDLGPEAGERGGQVVAAGTPEAIVESSRFKAQSSKLGKPKAHSALNLEPGTLNLISHTATALAPVLAAGPHVERKKYDPAEQTRRNGDLEIAEVGKTAKMPWEANGQRWHTQDRVGRNGQPCRWDGRILEQVVERIQSAGDFAETDWNERSVVEICAPKKSDGWFFHAITGETWLLKLKFRVYRGTFKRDELQSRIELKTLNELADLPIYGNEPRVKVKTLRGPWQEVEIRAHSLAEVDTPEFWSFLDDAVAGFSRFTEKAAVSPEDISPWKALGQKWHFLRKGFPPGKPVAWSPELLEELCELLKETAPGGQFLWNNQQLVHYMPQGRREPWATIQTKKPHALLLHLTGPKGKFGLGRLLELGADRELDDTRAGRDVVRLQFVQEEHLHRGDLEKFLQEHLASLSNGK
ncbi:MAG: excinuclease ABC subunit UvrA [Pirellulales bacterium]